MTRLERLACTQPRAEQRVRDPRKAWASVYKAASLPSVPIHDWHWSAVRNVKHTGLPRPIAMTLTGHKAETVYRRYAIVSNADLREAAHKNAGRVASVTFPSRSVASAGEPVA